MEQDLSSLAQPKHLELTLLEMSHNAVIELADRVAERPTREGDAGPFLERFAAFLQGETFALIGGVAVRAYLRDRPTMDLDVMIDEAHWDAMRRFLHQENADSTATVEDTYCYNIPGTELLLDVRLARSPLDRDALAHFVVGRYKRWQLRVVQPNHLVAMKVKAYAERKGTRKGRRDRDDILDLLGDRASAEVVRDLLLAHRPDLVELFDRIRREGDPP